MKDDSNVINSFNERLKAKKEAEKKVDEPTINVSINGETVDSISSDILDRVQEAIKERETNIHKWLEVFDDTFDEVDDINNAISFAGFCIWYGLQLSQDLSESVDDDNVDTAIKLVLVDHRERFDNLIKQLNVKKGE